MNNIEILRTVRSEFGKAIRKKYESGEIQISRHRFLQREIREDGMANTLDSVQKDNLLAVEVKKEDIDVVPKVMGGLGEKKSNGGSQFYQQDRIYDSSKIATSLSAKLPGGANMYDIEIPVKEATKQGYSLCRGGATASTFRCREAKQEEEESG